MGFFIRSLPFYTFEEDFDANFDKYILQINWINITGVIALFCEIMIGYTMVNQVAATIVDLHNANHPETGTRQNAKLENVKKVKIAVIVVSCTA
jgi:hypothetical protein